MFKGNGKQEIGTSDQEEILNIKDVLGTDYDEDFALSQVQEISEFVEDEVVDFDFASLKERAAKEPENLTEHDKERLQVFKRAASRMCDNVPDGLSAGSMESSDDNEQGEDTGRKFTEEEVNTLAEKAKKLKIFSHMGGALIGRLLGINGGNSISNSSTIGRILREDLCYLDKKSVQEVESLHQDVQNIISIEEKKEEQRRRVLENFNNVIKNNKDEADHLINRAKKRLYSLFGTILGSLIFYALIGLFFGPIPGALLAGPTLSNLVNTVAHNPAVVAATGTGGTETAKKIIEALTDALLSVKSENVDNPFN